MFPLLSAGNLILNLSQVAASTNIKLR